MKRFLLTTLVLSFGLVLPGMGASVPEAPEIQKALVFRLENGLLIEPLGSPDAEYEATYEDGRFHVRVFDAAGEAVRAFSLRIPEGTPYHEALVAPPSPPEGAHVDNHSPTCHSSGYCADIDTQGVLDSSGPNYRMWHGLMVYDYAPLTTSPSTTYYKYACNTGTDCTIWLETYYHYNTQWGIPNYGSIHCHKHGKPPGHSQFAVWTRAFMGGTSVDGGPAVGPFTKDTASC